MNKKNILITGATGDIGMDLAFKYIDIGYNLYFINYSQTPSKIKKIMNYAKSKDVICEYTRIDFGKDKISRWKKKINSLLKSIKKLDVLINNSGYLNQKNFKRISEEEWQKTINVNLKSVFFITQFCDSHLKKTSCIINISSIGGQIGGDLAPHYAASKAGVISLTKSFAKIFSKKKIRVNCVAPGVIKTKMVNKMIKKFGKNEIIKNHLIKRLGKTNDVVEACLYLSSSRSEFITGHTLNVNGGSYLG
tara:strand:+ start:2514 stop:3260 length:747 start_codon:yes stop_codon:yes gene_type:complete